MRVKMSVALFSAKVIVSVNTVMLIKFKSKASGDVIMLGESGQEMLRLLGKDADDSQGIFSVRQLPAAITALKQAVVVGKAIPDPRQMETSMDTDMDCESGDGVRLYQRALQVFELIERALQEDTYVTWGVCPRQKSALAGRHPVRFRPADAPVLPQRRCHDLR